MVEQATLGFPFVKDNDCTLGRDMAPLLMCDERGFWMLLIVSFAFKIRMFLMTQCVVML